MTNVFQHLTVSTNLPIKSIMNWKSKSRLHLKKVRIYFHWNTTAHVHTVSSSQFPIVLKPHKKTLINNMVFQSFITNLTSTLTCPIHHNSFPTLQSVNALQILHAFEQTFRHEFFTGTQGHTRIIVFLVGFLSTLWVANPWFIRVPLPLHRQQPTGQSELVSWFGSMQIASEKNATFFGDVWRVTTKNTLPHKVLKDQIVSYELLD